MKTVYTGEKDARSFKDVLKQSVNRPGVKYIRVGRKNNARMYAEGSRFEIGRAIELRAGTDVTLIACGVMVHEAMQAANALAQMGIDAGVVDCSQSSPWTRKRWNAAPEKRARL